MSAVEPAILLIFSGLLAGLIDSIAGGGGLITVPSLSLVLGHGPHAIGTNKLAAATGTLIAFLIYLRHSKMKWKRTLGFTFIVAFFSFLGSQVNPLVPKTYFPWALLFSCPLVLFVVYKKDMWVKIAQSERPQGLSYIALFLSASVCGFYDGIWGPGGGTFLFLCLILFCHMPLMEALAAAKLANFASASFSFTGYAIGGYIHWREGFGLAAGMAVGSFLGATIASRNQNTASVVRLALVVVVCLLLVRVASELFGLG
jgi:uncharacterized membrane protein YfcA